MDCSYICNYFSYQEITSDDILTMSTGYQQYDIVNYCNDISKDKNKKFHESGNLEVNNLFHVSLRKKIEKELEEVREEENFYEDNWDGYGAKAISQKSIDMMFNYLKYFDEDIEIPEIMLEPYGTIALYWGTNNGNFFISFNDIINKIEFALTNKYTGLNMSGELESIDSVKEFIKMI